MCSSSIIESLKNSLAGQLGGAKLAYYYFVFDNVSTHEVDTFLRSIISQLCPEENVPYELRSLHAKRSPAKPSCGELRSTLLSLLRRIGGKPEPIESLGLRQDPKEIFLVFDGLDELPHGTVRRSMIDLILGMASVMTSDHIHVLITSRPERDISAQFPSSQGWIRHKMHADKILIDIESYTARQIAVHPGLNALPPRLKENIMATLVHGSYGM